MRDPSFGYYGGKAKWRDRIIPLLPRSATYVEPYFGSGAVFFGKPRSARNVINDLNPRMANLYRAMQSDPWRVASGVALSVNGRDDLAIAAERCDDPIEQARRTFLRIMIGVNHVDSDANVYWARSFSKQARAPQSRAARVGRMGELLAGVEVRNEDATGLIAGLQAEDVVAYLDPPYVKGTRVAPDVYGCEMSDDDHGRMIDAILSRPDWRFVISGYGNDLYDSRLKGWNRVEFAAHTHAVGGPRAERTEVLWLNFDPPSRELAL